VEIWWFEGNVSRFGWERELFGCYDISMKIGHLCLFYTVERSRLELGQDILLDCGLGLYFIICCTVIMA